MGTHLVLTVGTNPLPLWVSIQHLLGHFDDVEIITLIHSKETQRQTDSLIAFLNTSRYSFERISAIPGRPADLRKQVTGHLNKYHAKNLHLNYTGGTKVLGVNAWHAIRDFVSDKEGYSASTSYLDPRESPPCLVDHRDTYIVSDARKNIDITLDELAELHGCVLESSHQPDEEEIANALRILNAVSDWEKFRKYKEWYGRWFQIEELQETLKNEQAISLEAPPIKVDWIPIAEFLNQRFNLQNRQNNFSAKESDASGSFRLRNLKKKNRKSFKDVRKWISGEFLELAVFDSLRRELRNRTTAPKWSIGQSIYFKNLNANKNFEVDVLAVLGYQVIVISCTTSRKETEIKSKAIEALHRGRQIGGDEARAICICGANVDDNQTYVPDLIERDVAVDIGVDKLPLQIWGWDCWQKLDRKFREYLDEMEWGT